MPLSALPAKLAICRSGLAAWYKAHGKPVPDFTDEQLAAAIQSGLKHGVNHLA